MSAADLPLLPIDTPELRADSQPLYEAARAQHPWLALGSSSGRCPPDIFFIL
jgi:hypothetical protein